MPVYKRAARPTAARAVDDPRDPQFSDNDFTVLFKRPSPPSGRTDRPGAPTVPVAFVPRHVAPPKPAPKPPRAALRADSPQIGAAVPTGEEIETVVVPPRLRDRAVRVAVFLAVGCVVGVGVELFVHTTWPEPPSVEASPLSTSAARAEQAQEAPGVSILVASDKGVTVQAPHPHHAHHAAPGASPAAAAAIGPVSTGDAGVAVDDLTAAMQTLTKAKEETTLP